MVPADARAGREERGGREGRGREEREGRRGEAKPVDPINRFGLYLGPLRSGREGGARGETNGDEWGRKGEE